MLAAVVSATATVSLANGDDVRALVAEAMADARTRPSLVAEGFGASGHDGNFFLASSDDAFRLEFSGFTQLRYIANFTRDAAPDEYTGGFVIRRTRLTFSGHAIDPSLTFKVTHSFDRRHGGASELSDGSIEKAFESGVRVRAGQFKLPFLREELHSAKGLLAVDRSLVRDEFSLRRSQGVMMSIEGERTIVELALSNGGDSANLGFANDPTDYAVTVRGQLLLDGSWRSFRRAGATEGQAFSWVLSGAGHVEEGAFERTTRWTFDTAMKGDGWSLLLAYVGRETHSGGVFRDHGVVVQAAARHEDLEPFARFDVILPDGDRPGDDAFRTLTLGANWYLRGEALKLSADLSWHLDDSASNDLVGGSSGVGFVATGERGELVARAQVQLAF